MKRCPFCAEEIQDAAIVCRFCNADLVKQQRPDHAVGAGAQREASSGAGTPVAQVPDPVITAKAKSPIPGRAVALVIGLSVIFLMLVAISWVQFGRARDEPPPRPYPIEPLLVRTEVASGGVPVVNTGADSYDGCVIDVGEARATIGAIAPNGESTVTSQSFTPALTGDIAPMPRTVRCKSSRAIGQTFRTRPEPGYPSTVYQIVGVIPDTKYNGLRGDTPPLAFAPDSQYPPSGPWAAVMIHSTGDTAAAMARIRNRVKQWHPEVVMEFEDFQTRIRDGLVRERLLAMLAGFFGVVAAVLAMVGLYGMISFSVARRQREIGIRAAVGARRSQVVAMVMREAVALMSVGLVIGAAAALLAGQSAATLLFGLTPRDPLTLLGACLLLTTITAAASLIPARRASRLDPLTALRQE